MEREGRKGHTEAGLLSTVRVRSGRTGRQPSASPHHAPSPTAPPATAKGCPGHRDWAWSSALHSRELGSSRTLSVSPGAGEREGLPTPSFPCLEFGGLLGFWGVSGAQNAACHGPQGSERKTGSTPSLGWVGGLRNSLSGDP